MLPVIAGGAALGALGGALKSGPKFQLSALGQQGQASSQAALSAYQNLVGAGPNQSDVTASLDASRGFANTLSNVASSGLYDMSAGNRLAAQQFGAQRQQMEQTFADQLQQANRSAALAGRSSNDPILRARLAQEQSRQSLALNAQQSSAAMQLGRQSTTDMLGLQGQRVDLLQGLSNQAFSNQQNLFGMGSQAMMNDYQMQMGQAQYEQSRGGGLKGALTGAITGAGAGMQMAQGFGALKQQSAITNRIQDQSNPFQGFQLTPSSTPGLNQGWGGMAVGNYGSPIQSFAPSAPSASFSTPMAAGYNSYNQRDPYAGASPQGLSSFFGGFR